MRSKRIAATFTPHGHIATLRPCRFTVEVTNYVGIHLSGPIYRSKLIFTQ